MTTPIEALTYISNARWNENADIDDICTMADRALASLTASPDREKVAALAHRFWSIHPSEIAAKNLTREEFYAREMMSLLSTIAPDEAAIRAAAFEEAAKIVTSRVEGIELQRFVFNGVTSTDTRGNDLFIAKSDVEKLFNDRAATIRSQEAGR